MSTREGATPREYVAGFMFSGPDVLLVRKTRPEWQKGKLNGVGGKVEPGETPDSAMRREAFEETRIDAVWEHFATLSGGGFVVHFYRSEGPIYDAPPENDVGEELGQYVALHAPSLDTIPNLRWLIPMAHPSNRHDWPFEVRERADPNAGGEDG